MAELASIDAWMRIRYMENAVTIVSSVMADINS